MTAMRVRHALNTTYKAIAEEILSNFDLPCSIEINSATASLVQSEKNRNRKNLKSGALGKSDGRRDRFIRNR